MENYESHLGAEGCGSFTSVSLGVLHEGGRGVQGSEDYYRRAVTGEVIALNRHLDEDHGHVAHRLEQLMALLDVLDAAFGARQFNI